MGELKEASQPDLPPAFVLREKVIERVGRTGRRMEFTRLDPSRDELWALYGDDKVRIDFRPFRVLLTAFRFGEGPRPVVELRLLPDRAVAPTRWTLTSRSSEDPWLVVDAVLDQLESHAEMMRFRYRAREVTREATQSGANDLLHG
jgi:hypothetical protein